MGSRSEGWNGRTRVGSQDLKTDVEYLQNCRTGQLKTAMGKPNHLGLQLAGSIYDSYRIGGSHLR